MAAQRPRGLAQECQAHFQTSNLYEIFSVQRTATDVQGNLEFFPSETVAWVEEEGRAYQLEKPNCSKLSMLVFSFQ